MLLTRPTSRRKFLLSSLIALPAMGVTVKGLTAAAAAEMAAPSIETYKPAFFSPGEWAFIMAACDQLIPVGGKTPGALETNVPIFMDQQLAGDLGSEIYLDGPFDLNAPKTLGYQIPYIPQQIYRKGIGAVDAWCQQNHKANFAALSVEERVHVLKKIQAGEVNFKDFGEDILPSKLFFSEMLTLTQQGYLSDPIYGGNKGMKAWIAIGFPGARASYLEWVAQHNVPYPLGPVSLNGDRG
ncbi:gluconate 2-dehydrogenase subunit 3 family protein [Pseudomonas sp. v388]|uniref:gluconate 2-dehydrogenase subunit 3 family protein n=1 Tax=Pseudomonas sp. v388 TaxID=2479849 RepID=UPI000F76C158|nr:gluconate 2-dehydrogenase subunit 3 family protein [Pseudomonas sp. v388]RRV10502.1 gluconate 2-dehydrogenase subunit 3 family protein [Pseudomonas sp. v388]